MLCRNELKQKVCLWEQKDVNRRVTIMEGLQNIMQKVYSVTGRAPSYVTGQNIEAL